jgi:hypothetical protein
MGIGVKKAVRYAIVFSLSIVILTLVASSLAVKAQQIQQVAIGVYPGDSFTYGTPDGSPWVQMTSSNEPPLTGWEQFMNLSTINFYIINDSSGSSSKDPGYTFNETVTFRNGTAPFHITNKVDLYQGGGTGTIFFISSGLEADSYIYPGAVSSNYTWAINATRVDQLYWPGVPVCVLNSSEHTPYVNSSSPLIGTQTTFYWDQQTGVLLGAFEEAAGYNGLTGSSIGGALLYELIANNVNIPMNYPSSLDMTPIYAALAIGGIVVLGAVVVRTVVSTPKPKYKRLKEK